MGLPHNAALESERTFQVLRMTSPADLAPVLAAYPADCQPSRVESLGSAGGFSGASFWRLSTPRGLLCLRRWPSGYPTTERLQFIQAVLWHVDREGFTQIPLPLEAINHAGYVTHDGSFWELAPWMPGVADYHTTPNDAKLVAALVALARFHVAAASFPLADIGPSPSPGLVRREERFRQSAHWRYPATGRCHSRRQLARVGSSAVGGWWPCSARPRSAALGPSSGPCGGGWPSSRAFAISGTTMCCSAANG